MIRDTIFNNMRSNKKDTTYTKVVWYSTRVPGLGIREQ